MSELLYKANRNTPVPWPRAISAWWYDGIMYVSWEKLAGMKCTVMSFLKTPITLIRLNVTLSQRRKKWGTKELWVLWSLYFDTHKRKERTITVGKTWSSMCFLLIYTFLGTIKPFMDKYANIKVQEVQLSFIRRLSRIETNYRIIVTVIKIIPDQFLTRM